MPEGVEHLLGSVYGRCFAIHRTAEYNWFCSLKGDIRLGTHESGWVSTWIIDETPCEFETCDACHVRVNLNLNLNTTCTNALIIRIMMTNHEYNTIQYNTLKCNSK